MELSKAWKGRVGADKVAGSGAGKKPTGGGKAKEGIGGEESTLEASGNAEDPQVPVASQTAGI